MVMICCFTVVILILLADANIQIICTEFVDNMYETVLIYNNSLDLIYNIELYQYKVQSMIVSEYLQPTY